ncbi:hypothetical protein BH18ACT15_BH18ACT15_05700 [soil metagenome]
MPRKKKHPSELTTEEAMKKLFPKQVREGVKKVAADQGKRSITKKDK